MHRNKAFHPLIISFCVSLRAYMLDTVAISAVFGLGLGGQARGGSERRLTAAGQPAAERMGEVL